MTAERVSVSSCALSVAISCFCCSRTSSERWNDSLSASNSARNSSYYTQTTHEQISTAQHGTAQRVTSSDLALHFIEFARGALQPLVFGGEALALLLFGGVLLVGGKHLLSRALQLQRSRTRLFK